MAALILWEWLHGHFAKSLIVHYFSAQKTLLWEFEQITQLHRSQEQIGVIPQSPSPNYYHTPSQLLSHTLAIIITHPPNYYHTPLQLLLSHTLPITITHPCLPSQKIGIFDWFSTDPYLWKYENPNLRNQTEWWHATERRKMWSQEIQIFA